MGKKRSELDSLYRSISEKFDVGTFEEFSNKMQTPEDRKRFYDVVLDRGIDLGDYSEYERRLGGVQGVSAQGSAGTSETSGQPSGSSAEPSLAGPNDAIDGGSKEIVEPASDSTDLQQLEPNQGAEWLDETYTDRAKYSDVPEGYIPLSGVNLGDGIRGISAIDPATGDVTNVMPEVSVVAPTKQSPKSLREFVSAWESANPDAPLPVRLMEEVDNNGVIRSDDDSESWTDRASDRAGYIYNQVLSGIGAVMSEAIDLSLIVPDLLMSGTGPEGTGFDPMSQQYRDYIAPKVRESLVNTVGVSQSDATVNRYKNEFLTASVGGLAYSAPAFVGNRLRTARLFLQSTDGALQSIEEADTDNALSPLEKTLYATTVGTVVASLEKTGIERIFGNNTQRVANYVANRAIKEAIEQGGGKVTGRLLSSSIRKSTARLTNAIASYGEDAVRGIVTEGLTGSAQEIATIGSEYIVNELAGNKVFDTPGWDNFSDNIARVLESGAMEAVGGGILGGISGISSYANRDAIYKKQEQINKIDAELASSEDMSTILPLVRTKIRLMQDISKRFGDSYEKFMAMSLESKQKVIDINQEYDSLQTILDSPESTDESKSIAEERIKELSEELDAIPTEVAPSELSPERVDENILAFRDRNPETGHQDVMYDIPEQVWITLDRLDAGTSVDPVAAREASEALYNKYKELTELKKSQNRLITISEINELQGNLESDIISLENHLSDREKGVVDDLNKVKTEDKTPDSTIDNVDETSVSETEQESERIEAAGQQVQSEAEASVVADETDQGVEAIQTTESEVEQVSEVPQVEQSASEGAETAPVSDEVSVTDTTPQQEAEVTPEAQQADVQSVEASEASTRLPQFATPLSEGEKNILARGESVNQAHVIEDAIAPQSRRGRNIGSQMSRAIRNGEITYDQAVEAITSANLQVPASIEALNPANESGQQSAQQAAPTPQESTAVTPEQSGQPESTIEGQVGAATVFRAIDYSRPEINNYRPDQQLRFGQGEHYEPVHLVSQDSEYIELIGIGARARQKLRGKSASINEYRRAKLEDKYGISAIDANKQARDIAKENRDRDNATIVELIPPIPPTDAPKTQPNLKGDAPYKEALVQITEQQPTSNQSEVEEQQPVAQRDIAPEEPVAEQESVGSTAVADGGTRPQGAKAKTPKTLLKGVADRLSKTGLAKSVKIMTSEEIVADLTGRANIQFQKGEDIKGYVDADGNIVINSDTASLDTPIHEFSHVWERTVETQNPFLHQRGMELIQSEEGKPYVDHVKKTQPSLTGRALYKEALAQAIGDRGARLIESQKNSPIKQWLKDAWDFIAKMVGLSEMTASQVSKLTLQEFADAVAVDLLSGKPFAKMPNGDVVVKTEVASESDMDEADRFMAEFMERMRKRNGVSFQGNISSSLSPQDFRDLTTFFRHAKSKGLISGIADARALATAMNIANVSQVDMAFKLSEFTGKGVTGFKKSEVSAETIANTKFDKISDSKYREIGRNLVESGVVNPTELVDDLIHNRRVPLPEEVAALQYYSTQLDNQRNEIRDLVRKGTKEQVDKFSYQGESGYNALSIKADALSQARFDLEVAMLQSAHLQASAFRLRSVMSDKDFNIVTYLAEMKARGYVDPEVEKRLIELSAELESVRAKLREKMEEAEKKSDEIGFDNIKQEASKPEPKRRRVKPRKEVVEKVTQVLDSLDVTSFGLPGMNFQANGTIRFQVNPNPSVADSVQRAVAQMKASIAEGVNIGEAIETAIDAVSSEVGAENWDSVKFRSVVTNQLVQEEVSFKSRKPYVDSSGQLIVPGEYLKGLVRSGIDTIDGMVEAVNAEMGGSFSPYDIQNAISGYGRQAASKRSDLDRKISKARRIARLMSAVEDLQEKGTRVKTRKAASENDTRINELLDTIKKLEYDLEMTPEERSQYYTKRKNESRRKYLENYISEVEERIRNKDFEPVSHVNTYEKDQETLDLEQEAQRIRNEFKKEKYRHELETRTPTQKLRSLAYDITFNILRGLTAGADASAVGVQGAIITAARPGYMAKTFIDTLGKTFSEAEYDAYFETLQSDPFFEMARKANLNLQLPSFYQSVQEEQYKGQFPELIWNSFVSNPVGWAAGKITGKDTKMMREVLADKANPFTLGDRNYSLVLSQIRMDLFREFITNQINKQGLNTELDTKTIEQVAEMVNTLTMASKVPVFTGKLGNDILSATLFSARKLIATWKVLGAWAPLLVGSNRNPQLLYDAYGKILLKGLGTMFAVSALPIATAGLLRSVGDDDEEEEDFYFDNKNFFNPIHSDFMKIRLGDTRISLFQGIDGNIIFLSRFASNHYMTSSSQGVKRLDGQQGRNTRGRLILDYMRNKLAPTPSLAVNALGDDRDKQEGVQRFRDSFMPMWASGIREQYDSTGDLPETMFLGAAGFFGLSFNNYGGAEFAKPNGTDNAKVLELYSKSGLGAYDPTPNTRTAFDGKRVSKVGGSEFKDKYLPAYQEYMTQVSLSLRHKISTDKHWEHKEGVVDNWKREAYKYAEIKTTGVYVKDRFDRFSKNGTEYRLTESQYALKAGYIKEFMEGSGARKELRGVRANVRAKLRAEGAQSTATPEYTQMLIDLQLYNKANSYANERLYQDMRRRKINLVTSADFTSDMNELPEE